MNLIVENTQISWIHLWHYVSYITPYVHAPVLELSIWVDTSILDDSRQPWALLVGDACCIIKYYNWTLLHLRNMYSPYRVQNIHVYFDSSSSVIYSSVHSFLRVYVISWVTTVINVFMHGFASRSEFALVVVRWLFIHVSIFNESKVISRFLHWLSHPLCDRRVNVKLRMMWMLVKLNFYCTGMLISWNATFIKEHYLCFLLGVLVCVCYWCLC